MPEPTDKQKLDINTNLMLGVLKARMNEILEQFVFEPANDKTIAAVTASLASFLKPIQERKGFEDIEQPEAYTVHIGWKDLYPKLGARVVAYLLYLLNKVSGWCGHHYSYTNYTIKWYHLLLPYRIEKPTIVIRYWDMQVAHMELVLHDLDDEECELTPEDFFEENPPSINWVLDWVEKNAIVQESAKLMVPYEALRVNLRVRPAKVLEYITMNFTLGQ